MQNITTPVLLSFFLTNLLCLHLTSAYEPLYYYESNITSTDHSTYESNLEMLFSYLYAEAVAEQGFSEKLGIEPDQISGLVLCRGDVNSSDCSDCINQSFGFMRNLPYPIVAAVWYDPCLLLYSNDSDLVNSTINYPYFLMWNINNFTDNQKFSGWDNGTINSSIESTLKELLTKISEHAAFNSTKRFGTGMTNKKTVPVNGTGTVGITATVPNIYGLSQCIPSPSFSNKTCRDCLQDLIDKLLASYGGRQGGRIVGVKCNLRYEIYNFFNVTPDIQLGSVPSTEILPPSPSILPPSWSPPPFSQIPSPPFEQSGEPTLSPRPSNSPTDNRKSKGEKIPRLINFALLYFMLKKKL